jgi:hypothetical protein
MVHAALLLLMLEAANAGPRFTISLKRSTQNLQLSTSRRPITPFVAMTQQIGALDDAKNFEKAFQKAFKSAFENVACSRRLAGHRTNGTGTRSLEGN